MYRHTPSYHTASEVRLMIINNELGCTQPASAPTNYQVRNGRMQNSLLSSLLCSAIDGFNEFLELCPQLVT